MPFTYEYECPAGHGRFEQRRPGAESAEPAPCPTCRAVSPKRLNFNPRTQLFVSSRFAVTIPTTGWKGTHGGGDWENAVADYRRWDSEFAPPRPEVMRDCAPHEI